MDKQWTEKVEEADELNRNMKESAWLGKRQFISIKKEK